MQALVTADALQDRVSAAMFSLLAMRLGRLAISAVATRSPMTIRTLCLLGASTGLASLILGLLAIKPDLQIGSLFAVSAAATLAGVSMALGMIASRTVASHLASPEKTNSITMIAWSLGAALPVLFDDNRPALQLLLASTIVTFGFIPTLLPLASNEHLDGVTTAQSPGLKQAVASPDRTGMFLFVLYSGLSAALATVINAYILPVFRHELKASRGEIAVSFVAISLTTLITWVPQIKKATQRVPVVARLVVLRLLILLGLAAFILVPGSVGIACIILLMTNLALVIEQNARSEYAGEIIPRSNATFFQSRIEIAAVFMGIAVFLLEQAKLPIGVQLVCIAIACAISSLGFLPKFRSPVLEHKI